MEDIVYFLPFDSIMVHTSPHDHVENFARTRSFIDVCHDRGFAVEVEIGRLDGGEDGIADTGDLEGPSVGRWWHFRWTDIYNSSGKA